MEEVEDAIRSAINESYRLGIAAAIKHLEGSAPADIPTLVQGLRMLCLSDKMANP